MKMPIRSLVERELIYNVEHSNLEQSDKKVLKKIIRFYYQPTP